MTRSWWEDWAEWAAERSGQQVEARELPLGEPAPGLYVRNQTGRLRPLTESGPDADGIQDERRRTTRQRAKRIVSSAE